MTLGTIPSASPAVNFREVDLTGRVPNDPTSVGAFAGNFNWGPVGVPTLVSNESGLVQRFSIPTNINAVDFHSAAYFLKYTDNLYVIRELDGDSADATSAVNAYAMTSPGSTPLVKTSQDFEAQEATLNDFSGDSDGNAVRGHSIIARYPGTLGNSIQVQICPGDSDETVFAAWDYEDFFDGAPGTSSYAAARDGSWDEVHVIVIDAGGEITGTAGTVLERFPYLSTASDAKNADGSTNYVLDVLNSQSDYVHMASFGSSLAFDSDEWGGSSTVGTSTTKGTPKVFTNGLSVKTYTLANGANSGALGTDDFIRAFDTIEDQETINVDIIIAPQLSSAIAQATVVNDLVSTAGSLRRDAIVVTSPNRSAVVNNSATQIVTDIVACANRFTASSYLAIDGNFLKVYDRYNDKYIWIPAASSTAGLMAATDRNAAPWFSPAGTRRGQYLAIQDIAFNPTKSQRDTLYKASVNPICNLVGEGTMLYGDKTNLRRPSAFDRINVRRLFLKIEKDIVQYARTVLFELNDEFTRAEFVGVVEPYLRDVQARRGIYDYLVVCDETNNTPEVIDNNEFVASIFVKPARSINFITLNFVAVRTGVSFEEVVGAV
jgi:hypothetical protein